MNSQSWLRDVAGGTDGFGGVSPMKTRFRANWRFWSLPVKNRPRINVQEQRNEATPTLGVPPKPLLQPISRAEFYHLSFQEILSKEPEPGLSSTCYPCPRTPVTLDSGLYTIEGRGLRGARRSFVDRPRIRSAGRAAGPLPAASEAQSHCILGAPNRAAFGPGQPSAGARTSPWPWLSLPWRAHAERQAPFRVRL